MSPTPTDSRPTLDQRRARHAWSVVERLMNPEIGRPKAKEYQREARKLPARIMTAGLGQALAFLKAKAGSREMLNHLLRDLTDWVIINRELPGRVPDSLLLSVIQGDADFLQQATDETIEYVRWLNRFLEAQLGEAEIEED